MAAQYFAGPFYQSTPDACVVDLTPPTFTGISALTAQTNGTLLVAWPAATDSTGPITYDIYIAQGTVLAAALFLPANITMSYRPTGAGPFNRYIYQLGSSGAYLVYGQTYTVGVRCRDGVSNENTNVALLTAISNGVLPDNFAQVYSQLVALVTAGSVVGGKTFVMTKPNFSMEITIDPQLIP